MRRLGASCSTWATTPAARRHLEQGIALTDPAAERTLALRHGVAPGVTCLTVAANALWCLGAPVQAVRRSQEAQTLAQELAHTLATAYHFAAVLYHRCREAPAVQAQADTCFRQALAIARCQQAKSWELRAAMSLSRLCQQQGQRDEAYGDPGADL